MVILSAQFDFFKTECLRYARNIHVDTGSCWKAHSRLKEHKCLFVVGRPGDGKTSLCKWLVFKSLQEGYEVILVKTPDDWRKYVNPRRKQIIVIDDIFGSSQLNTLQCDGWFGMSEEILIKDGFLRLLMTSRTQIYQNVCIPYNKAVFGNVLDLGAPDNILTLEEKKEMFMHHILLNKRQIPNVRSIDFCFLDRDILGFPLCCHLFFSDDHLFGSGYEYFTNPQRFLQELISNMAVVDPCKYCALVFCLLNGGAILHSAFSAMTELVGKKEIFEACKVESSKPLTSIHEAARQLLGTFLINNEEKQSYEFQHASIQEAICRHLSKFQTDIILAFGDLNFIADNLGVESNMEATINPIKLQASGYPLLFNRIIKELDTRSLIKFMHERNAMNSFELASSFMKFLSQKGKLMRTINHAKFSLLVDNIHEVSGKICFKNRMLMNVVCKSSILDYIVQRHTPNPSLGAYIRRRCCPSIKHCVLSAIAIFRGNESILHTLMYSRVTSLHSNLLLWTSVVNDLKAFELLLACGADPVFKGQCNITPLHCASQEGHVDIVKVLLTYKDAVHCTSDNKATPLHYAAQEGHTTIAELLLVHGAKHDALDQWGHMPLHRAAKFGHANTSSILLEHGASPNARANNKYTALHCAAENGHLDVINCLFRHSAQHSIRDNLGYTPLHWTAQKGYISCARALINAGAKVNCKTLNGRYTPLHWAVQKGNAEIVELLLSHNANVNIRDEWGYLPIHRCVKFGHFKCLIKLISHETRINDMTIKGCTPVHIAAQRGHFEIMKMLLEHDAKAYIPDKTGSTSLMEAALHGSLPCVQLLVRSGINVNAAKKDGSTALHMAAMKGHTDVLEFLLKVGAEHSKTDESKGTPVHRAAQEGHTECVRLLLSFGASHQAMDDGYCTPIHLALCRGHADTLSLILNFSTLPVHKDYWGLMPLHWSALRGHIRCTELLMKHGMNHSVVDQCNYTPLHWAAQQGNSDVVRLLLQYEADKTSADKWGKVPLDRAKEFGHSQCEKLLS